MSNDSSNTHYQEVSTNTIFGFWIYLMTDAILFSTLFATYAVLKKSTFGGPGAAELFNLPYALAETLVLLFSSLTCGLAMLAVSKQSVRKTIGWYAVTFLLGDPLFVDDRSRICRSCRKRQRMAAERFLNFLFHPRRYSCASTLSSVLLFMLFFLWEVVKRGLVPLTIRALTCLKIFWFFSYFVWIFMFAIVYLMEFAHESRNAEVVCAGICRVVDFNARGLFSCLRAVF